MPARLKFIVAYDGGPFAGWQSQARGDTIQDRLERAFREVGGQRVRVHGAGRTDAGVHALAQCAHVDLADRNFPKEKWTAALNAFLPPTIRVLRCNYVDPKFHARFSAKGKVYRYRISNAPILSPFEKGRAWHVIRPLDFDTMAEAAAHFIGKHDFARFTANRGTPAQDTVRTIHDARARRAGSLITIEFDGDGFLYKMARLMSGALVQCGLGKIRARQIVDLLRLQNAKQRVVAPAEGLFLVRVRY
ncbi:MAG: tRNA pseudouridine38-40 synthase [Verrucomicrobiota bacterium]|jgi:tRNA pseudouridine38-40 synthase